VCLVLGRFPPCFEEVGCGGAVVRILLGERTKNGKNFSSQSNPTILLNKVYKQIISCCDFSQPPLLAVRHLIVIMSLIFVPYPLMSLSIS